MFAYCCNTPVSTYDPSGTVCVPALQQTRDGSFREGATADRYSAGDAAYARKEARKEAWKYVTNTDEQVVLDATGIAFYKGVPVVPLPKELPIINYPTGKQAFSFGIMFIGVDVNSEKTVRHEYGHSMHLLMAGFRSYTVNAFIPSVLGFWFGGDEYDKNYYSHIYEYTAEVLGNVNRTYPYSPSTEKLWGWYLLYTVLYP